MLERYVAHVTVEIFTEKSRGVVHGLPDRGFLFSFVPFPPDGDVVYPDRPMLDIPTFLAAKVWGLYSSAGEPQCCDKEAQAMLYTSLTRRNLEYRPLNMLVIWPLALLLLTWVGDWGTMAQRSCHGILKIQPPHPTAAKTCAATKTRNFPSKPASSTGIEPTVRRVKSSHLGPSMV